MRKVALQTGHTLTWPLRAIRCANSPIPSEQGPILSPQTRTEGRVL